MQLYLSAEEVKTENEKFETCSNSLSNSLHQIYQNIWSLGIPSLVRAHVRGYSHYVILKQCDVTVEQFELYAVFASLLPTIKFLPPSLISSCARHPLYGHMSSQEALSNSQSSLQMCRYCKRECAIQTCQSNRNGNRGRHYVQVCISAYCFCCADHT